VPSALITGASRGLGLEFARQYLADGWQVYATCRDPASAFELRRLAEDNKGKLQIFALDVTDQASIHAAATGGDRGQHHGSHAGVGRVHRACGAQDLRGDHDESKPRARASAAFSNASRASS